jgi:hypothetical protein
MQSISACAVVSSLALASFGCGGGSGSTPSGPTVVTKGIVLVTQTSVGLVGLSPNPAYLLRLTLPVEIKAFNEIGCNLNFVRLQLFRGGVEIERAEVTANDIVALAGSNRVTSGRSLVFTINFGFNSSQFDYGTILLGATDDGGHPIESTLGNLRIELDPSLQ